MLKWTGHPLVDVGIATMLAMQDKLEPEEITEEDLAEVATYIAREYVQQPLKAFLTVAFTPNAWFAQDAYNPDKADLTPEARQERQAKRDVWAERHLWQWQSEGAAPDEAAPDVFTGQPAFLAEVSGKLPSGRAGRAQVPLLLGDDTINFYTNGWPGLPISALTLLCLHSFPLGCAKVAGKLLAVHSDDPALTRFFAQKFWEKNVKLISMARQEKSSKLAESPHAQRTLLIETLLEADRKRRYNRSASITAYHFTNGNSPTLDIYYLPLQTLAFLSEMYRNPFSKVWEGIVSKAWEQEPTTGRKKGTEGEFVAYRNWLFEDVWELPRNARLFLRTYLLRIALRYARSDKGDPRGAYSLQSDMALVSWPITARFLERIMNMDKERIEQIRALGDELARYIKEENDKRFFRQFATARSYDYFSALLNKSNLDHARRGHQPFLAYDGFVAALGGSDGSFRTDWRLVRDLLLIRMVEQLYQNGWLGQHPDTLAEVIEEQNKTADES